MAAEPAKEQFKRILADQVTPGEQEALYAEQRTDSEAARLRDSGHDYEKFLKEATQRASSRMQGREGRER